MATFQDSLCSPLPSGTKHYLQLREQMTSKREGERAACLQGFIFTATVAIVCLALSYFLKQMLSVCCAALTERARTSLVCLKERRDGLILTGSDGDGGFSKLGTCPTFSRCFHPAVSMTILTKSLNVRPLFSLPLSFLCWTQ